MIIKNAFRPKKVNTSLGINLVCILIPYRPKIRPKNGFFCYVPFLDIIFWITFCSNCNTLIIDSKVYLWNNLSGVKFIVIVSSLPLIDVHTKIYPKY